MSRRTKKRDDGWYDINLEFDESVEKELRPLFIGEYVRHSLNKLGKLEDIEQELGVDLIQFLKECKYVLEHCSMTTSKTSKGTKIVCDFGYVIDFINDIMEELL